MRQICKVQFGSHLYGTNTPSSDYDYKGVHIPDARDILLQQIISEVGFGPEKIAGAKNQSGDVEDKSYALHRFLQLLAQGQTGCVDMLFAPTPIETSDVWKHIWDNRHLLITKKSSGFVGYCRDQANKYSAKGDRVNAAKAAMDFFSTAIQQYGNPTAVCEFEEDLRKLCGEHTSIEEKETTPGRFETYFVCCNRMVGFQNTVKEAYKIYSNIYHGYGDRAKKAQLNGVDWKAVSHAVRVGHEALELFRTGHVTFPLLNREHVLNVKLGKVPFQTVSEELDRLLIDVEDAAQNSSFPDEADYEWIDALVLTEYAREVNYGVK
jgi:hypothetical protein